jgi:hypothetical protein
MDQQGLLRAVTTRPWVWALLLWLLLVYIYLASPVLRINDSKYTLLTTEHLLLHGEFSLDEHFWPHVDSSGYPEVRTGKFLPRHVRRYRGHLYYYYPLGTPVLTAPFVAVLRLIDGRSTIRPDGSYEFRTEKAWQPRIAAFLSAGACVLIFFTAWQLLGPGASVMIALAAGLSTQMWSTASRSLQAHTWIVVLLSAVLLILLRSDVRRSSTHPIVTATLLSWAFFTRPTAALFILPLSVYVLHRNRREFVWLAATGLIWCSLFSVYCQTHYGTWLPGYYLTTREELTLGNLWVGLPGQMISPSRGLLVFVPLVSFVVYLSIRNWKWIEHRNLAITAAAAIGLHTFNMAMWANWWGGFCYGPRFYTDLVPLFALLGILGFDAASRRRARVGVPPTTGHKLEFAAFVACFALGAVLNGAGAISEASSSWNREPRSVDEDPSRAFEWKRSQFMCALFPSSFEADEP